MSTKRQPVASNPRQAGEGLLKALRDPTMNGSGGTDGILQRSTRFGGLGVRSIGEAENLQSVTYS